MAAYGVVRPDDIRVYYTFNETAGTTAADSSGNAHDGTLTNMDDSAWVDGKFVGAISFDGSNDFLDIPPAAFPDAAATEFSIAFWANGGSSLPKANSVFYTGGRVQSHMPWTDNRVYWDVGPAGNDYDRINPTVAATDYKGRWKHWIFTKDRSAGSMKVFMDGAVISTGTNRTKAWADPTFFKLGSNPGGTQNWHGLIDEFRVYEVALSNTEAANLFNNGEGDINRPIVTVTGDSAVRVPLDGDYTDAGATATDVEDGDITEINVSLQYSGIVTRAGDLAAWWRLDEDGADSSGNGNHGAIIGPAGDDVDKPTFVDGKFGKAMVMPHTGGRLKVDSFSGVANSPALSISAWVHITDLGTDGQGDGAILGMQNSEMLFWVNQDGGSGPEPSALSFNVGPASTPANRVNAPEGLWQTEVWQHVAGVMDGATRKVYVDGALVATEANAPDTTYSMDGKTVELGARETTDTLWFNGMLDDVRVYGVALEDADVARIYGDNGAGDFVADGATEVDTSLLGYWTYTYSATDSEGNVGMAPRIVQVYDTAAPIIQLTGGTEYQHEQGTDWVELGYTIIAGEGGDPIDGAEAVIVSDVDTSVAGVYSITYDYTDTDSRVGDTVTREVTVSDTTPPDITLYGGETLQHLVGTPFKDPGGLGVDLVDGEIGVASSLYIPNQILHRGYHGGLVDSELNFNNNGGLIPDIPRGENLLTSVLNFGNDAAFQNAGVNITVGDRYRNLFIGYFFAKKAGDYEFGVHREDDRGVVWLDLDQDGVFEMAGVKGNEWINGHYNAGYGWATLEPGFYRFAAGHLENNGGSSFEVRFRAPAGAGPTARTRVNPGANAQKGLWFTDDFFTTGQTGTHTITYTVSDLSGNIATATRTVEIVAEVERPVISLVGRPVVNHPAGSDYTDEGTTLKSAAGEDLDASLVQVQGQVDKDTLGTYLLTYSYFNGNGVAAVEVSRTVHVIDSQAPVITLEGDAEMQLILGQPFVDPGVTITDNFSTGLVAGSTEKLPANNLLFHLDASNLPGVNDGGTLLEWPDVSGNGNDFVDVRGEPILVADALNGKPAVRVDGNDFLASPLNVERHYSVFAVGQYEGSDNERLLSSKTRNWILGFHSNRLDRFHPEAWSTLFSDKPATVEPHFYAATSTGSKVRFWSNGREIVEVQSLNGRMGHFQIGGYQTTSEAAAGDVAEVLVYNNHVVTEQERLSIEARLMTKYGFPGYPAHTPPDFSKLGEHEILYYSQDTAGNRTFETRKVTVVPDPAIPVIVLEGDALITVEGGSVFTDPGSKITNGAGEVQPGEEATVAGSVDTSILGIHTLTYSYEDDQQTAAVDVVREVLVVDTLGPVITLVGEDTIRVKVGDPFEEPGVTALDQFEGDLPVKIDHDRPIPGYVPGLLGGGMGGNYSNAANPGNYGVDPLGPTYAYTAAGNIWQLNWTIVYTGQVYDEDGKVAFLEHIDDKALLKVNGQTVLSNTSAGEQTTKSMDFGQGGWFDFELRMSNGAGGGGMRGTYGFGIDPEDDGTFVKAMNSDSKTMDLFRVWADIYTQFDTSTAGSYTIEYRAVDTQGNASVKTRNLIVVEDDSLPYIALNGEVEMTLEADPGATFTDPKAVVKDTDGSDLVLDLAGEGTVDPTTPGTYQLVYRHTHTDGTVLPPVGRTVLVVDSTPPVLTLAGGDEVRVFVNTPYTDAGATAVDSMDGDITVYSDLDSIPDALIHHVYHNNHNTSLLNFDNNGGLFAKEPAGTALLRMGYLNRGINMRNDNEFRRTHTGIRRNDHFQNLFYGNFHALKEGEYEFQISNVNDSGTIWLDKDQDGVLERIGDLGDERVTWGNQTTTVFLEPGLYRTAIGHSEASGGSGIVARFRAPVGGGPEVLSVIIPANANQAGVWSTIPTNVDTSTPGIYKIYFYAQDSYGNATTVARTIVVEEDSERPVITLAGSANLVLEAGFPYSDPGYVLDDFLGNPLDESQVVLTNAPTGMETGTFNIEYNFTDAGGHVADTRTRTVTIEDTIGPNITLRGPDPAKVPTGEAYLDGGATALDRKDGDVQVVSSAGFITDGLVLHLDAASFAGTLQDGEVIAIDWEDLSGSGHPADNQRGDPTWVEASTHGQPAVNFDGNDMIWTTRNFQALLNNYSIFTVGRYTGGDSERVFSSINCNWLFGFNAKKTQAFHPSGWVHNTGGEDTNWHIHAGTMNDSDRAAFWDNGNRLTNNDTGAPTVGYMPRNFQMGGYNSSSNMSKCEVSEVLLYDRILSSVEIHALQQHLDSKYNLNGGGDFQFASVDTSQAGEQDVTYLAEDSSGHRSRATRKVVVEDGAVIPVIVLTGGAAMTHPAGEPYEDPGATIQNAQNGETPVLTGDVDILKPGTYTLAYDFTDPGGNSANTILRTVTVIDQSPPVITLVGGETIEHQLGNPFTDPGFSATDLVEGDVKVDTSVLTLDLLRAKGFLRNNTDAHLNLHNNGGLLNENHVGEATFVTSREKLGVYFNDDWDFRVMIPQINRSDNYQFLVEGHFHTATGGRYEFGLEAPDDRGSVWLDLDQDGTFENNGDLGSELMNPGWNYGYREVALEPGFYRFAVAHREGSGGSRSDPRYRAISGEGPTTRARIYPGTNLQKGQWVLYNPINVLAPGEQTITYTASDSAGNTATLIRTVIVRNNPQADVIQLLGDPEMTVAYGEAFTDPGVEILDLDGQAVDGAVPVIIGEVDLTRKGRNTLQYHFTNTSGIPSRMVERVVHVVDSNAPIITLNGDTEVTVFQGSKFEDPGATAEDDYDGSLPVGSSENFPANGLVMHLDASKIVGKSDGDTVSTWYDISGAGNNADGVSGTPLYVADSLNGRPGVHFDGFSRLHTTTDYGRDYTIITVSRLHGSVNQRLLSSANRNWLLGYYGGFEDVFYPENGWATDNIQAATNNPHIYSATSGNRAVSFYADGRDKTAFSARVNNNYRIGQFQMGAYLGGNEPAIGDVNEVILYNRILGDTDRSSIEARLNAKYSLNGVSGVTAPVDPNTLGTYHIVYQAIDGAGNLGTSIRTVTVVPDPNSPVISLIGAPLIHHEAGSPFVDPGATLVDKEGNALDSSLISISSPVDVNTPGPYTITYNYRPEFDAQATEVTRTVLVEDTTAPEITLLGDKVVKLEIGETYTEAGATATDAAHGDVYVTNDLQFTYGRLERIGYKEGTSNDALLNLDNNGGILAKTPAGYALHINGPGNRGLDYDNRTEFWAGMVDAEGKPVAEKNDNFQILFTGFFVAHFSGRYEFGIDNQDDRTAIWLDLDQDGTFESAGAAGNEQLRNAGETGYTTRTLAQGHYKIGIIFREGGGSERTDVRYSKSRYPSSFSRQTIRPGIASQGHDWALLNTTPLDTSVPGSHTITYTARDASGHTTTATRTVIVVEDASLPFISLKGDAEMTHDAGTVFTDPKADVKDSGGDNLATDVAAAEGAVDADTLGEYTLTYKYTNAVDVTRKVTVVDTSAPEITLVAHPDYGGTDTVTFTVGNPWVDPGITIQDADTNAWFVSSRDWIPNKLFHAGFVLAHSGNNLNFENEGGLLARTPNGTNYFTKGARNQGFNYDSDTNFRSEPISITRNDNYASYISGYFHALEDGDYIFDSDKPDDDVAIWLDLDQNGNFNRNGALGDERLTWDDQTRTVTLLKGEYYRFIGGHSEGGGGSRGRFRIQTPEGAGPSAALANIKPSDPAQVGIWNIQGDGVIDPTYPGTHTITYYAMDAVGHVSTATRTVIIEEDPDAPVLTLVGDAEIQHQLHTTFEDQLPTIAQANGTPIDDQANITITGQVLQDTPGTYEIQYNYTDDQSRKAVPVNRTVIVADYIPPVLTVTGSNPFQLPPGFTYTDEGATAEDSIDGILTVTTNGANIDTTAEGEFTITYTATDAAGNTSTETRTVIVKDDPNRPIIHLTGGDTLTHEAGEPFIDPGTIVTNARGTTFTEEVIITGDTVDHTTLGTYTLLYNFTSTDGKTAPNVERSVTVVDTTPPDLQLTGGNQIRVEVNSTFTEPGYTVSDNLDDNLTVQIQLEITGLAPVVHWEFDETDGTVAMERMNGINGTLQNFPDPALARVSGKYGNALKFVGTDGSYVSLPGTDLLDLQAFTISLWINTDDFQRNGMLFEKTTDNTVNSQYNLHFDDSDAFYFRVNDGLGGVAEKTFITSDELQPSQWEHIAVSYDGSIQKIYINNTLIAQEQQDVTIPVTPSAGPAYIGAMAPGDAYFFTGLLDDLKIYDVAIEEQNIAEIRKRTGIDTSKVKLEPFRLNYTTTDTSGNTTTLTREVVVSNDANPPSITLTGLATIDLEIGEDYVEPGAIATDVEDGAITTRLQIQGNVDTTKAGTYTVTYDVMDLSFNKAEQVVRTVIVTDPSPSNPLDAWRTTHLSTLSTDDQKLDADPDKDGLANLLEYALNADPNVADSPTKLPTLDASTGSLSITYLRYKVPADHGISYHVEFTTDLLSGTWSDTQVTETPAAQQDDLQGTDFIRITATANTPIANEPAGQQFLRIRIQEL